MENIYVIVLDHDFEYDGIQYSEPISKYYFSRESAINHLLSIDYILTDHNKEMYEKVEDGYLKIASIYELKRGE